MRRHGGRRPGFRQRVFQIGHALSGIAVEHVADGEREDQAVVIAAAERLVEEEVAGFLEARDGADLVDPALHVGMPGLPVIGLGAVLDQHRIGHEQPGRFHVGDEQRVLVLRRNVARQHDADLVGEDFLAFVVDHAAAVAVAVEAQGHVGLARQHGVAHGVQHLHVFGVRIVVRKGVIELAIERHDLAADFFQHLRREGAGGAVAAGAHHLEMPLELRPLGEVGDIARRKILDEFVSAAARHLELRR